MKYEYCCKCDCATGKAGAGDDSLYTETDGPFCENCFPEFKSKQEQGEPVGWIDSKGNMICTKINESCKPLYTTPQTKKWAGLTENQIDKLEKEFIGFPVPNIYNFVKAIETKLKDKNGY